MKIIIMCEYSGKIRDEFEKLGHDAWSCDFLPTERPGKHIQGDALDHLDDGWDMMIGHPPCTYMCNSGVDWLHQREERWGELDKAAEFFLKLWNAPIPKICLENPIMHKYAFKLIKIKPTQIIQPYFFGHMETKATCLWLKNLHKLKGTNNVKMQMMELPKNERERLHYTPPGPDRWKIRSKTYDGIAHAMATQWGTTQGFQYEPVNLFE
jgi:hypothetical protein